MIKDHNDPIHLPIDLLSPIGCTLDEVVHTRALAYLLNPKPAQPHGLGKDVLVAILNKLPHGTGASKLLRLLCGQTDIYVVPEYRWREDGFRDRSVSRCDIWIEIKSRKRAGLLVIENKIGAPDSDQFRWYEGKARNWCRKHHKAGSLLLYLTRDKRELTSSSNTEWVMFSYLELASALRRVWLERPEASGRAWLALYIASITGGLLGIDMSRVQTTELADIKMYLGEDLQ
jgi:hypothetical protein